MNYVNNANMIHSVSWHIIAVYEYAAYQSGLHQNILLPVKQCTMKLNKLRRRDDEDDDDYTNWQWRENKFPIILLLKK